jgi:hypothetical protein
MMQFDDLLIVLQRLLSNLLPIIVAANQITSPCRHCHPSYWVSQQLFERLRYLPDITVSHYTRACLLHFSPDINFIGDHDWTTTG